MMADDDRSVPPRVTLDGIRAAHEALQVTATSTVETLAAGDLLAATGGASWADLRVPENVDRLHELLLPTPRTALDEELTELAGSVRADHPTPHAAAMALCDRVHDEVTYVTGATDVQTDAVQAWRQRKGVCQDISHLVVGLLRTIGVPARYVSGYLHPAPSAGIRAE